MATATPTGGEIRSDASYPLPDFMQRTGLGAKSVRRARREGLVVHRQGRRSFILGRDWLAHLEKTATV